MKNMSTQLLLTTLKKMVFLTSILPFDDFIDVFLSMFNTSLQAAEYP